jgi:hypothetical protein
LGKLDRFGGLQRPGDGPQFLQAGDPINPCRIRDGTAVRDDSGKLVRDLIETHRYGIRR